MESSRSGISTAISQTEHGSVLGPEHRVSRHIPKGILNGPGGAVGKWLRTACLFVTKFTPNHKSKQPRSLAGVGALSGPLTSVAASPYPALPFRSGRAVRG